MFGIEIIDASLVPAMFIALLGGLLSFASPCVLPIVPPYLAYMGGISMHEMTADGRAARKTILPAVFFVLGLSTVFLFLGFTASIFGRFFLENQQTFAILSGVVVYVFGLHFIGFRRALWITANIFALLVVFQIGYVAWTNGVPVTLSGVADAVRVVFLDRLFWLLFLISAVLQFAPIDRFAFMDREARIDAGDKGGSAIGAYVLGLAFAFGWTPCIGPQLGAILSLAASEASVARGTILLGVYALGLGIPFLLVAVFIQRSMGLMNRIKPYMGAIERAMGGLLIIVGIALLTGAFSAFSWWLLEKFPALAYVG